MNPRDKNHGLILVDNLCALSFFSLLKACFIIRPAKIYYFQATKIGLRIANWFRAFKIIFGEPQKIKDLILNDTCDGAASILRFEALKICLNNQAKINQEVKKCIPGFEKFFRKTCATGVSKEWMVWLQHLLLELNRAKVLARETGVSTRNIVLISHAASLLEILNIDSRYSGEIKVFPQPFETKALLYLIGPVIYSLEKILISLFTSLTPFKKKATIGKQIKPLIGVAAAWGFKGFEKNRLDDLFWWRRSKVSVEQIIYMFERQDFQPTRNRLIELENMSIQSIALNPKYQGDAPRAKVEKKRADFAANLKALLFYSKLALSGFLKKKYKRFIYALISWQIYKSEQLITLYNGKNIKGLFHFHESSLEFVNLATLQSNATRIGTHWSCFVAPNASSIRCHEVYFVWGEHDLNIILDSDSISKNIILSGCFLNEFSYKDEHQRAKNAIAVMKNQGIRLTLALFDNSLPVPNFYRFFLQWLVDDPNLGIVIKSKGGSWESVFEDGLEGLVKQAIDTGRVFIMDENATPADAALLADFAVGITGISAIAVAGLQGARVLYVDYEKLDQGVLKPYSIFHSLGHKRCVFYDFETLKNAVLEYTKNPESNPNLGDITPILQHLDPFRDGKASQRIGEYVNWYLESLDQNPNKKEALKTATEKYAEKWGADKVIRRNN